MKSEFKRQPDKKTQLTRRRGPDWVGTPDSFGWGCSRHVGTSRPTEKDRWDCPPDVVLLWSGGSRFLLSFELERRLVQLLYMFQTTATFTQLIGGSESNRQFHCSPPSRPIQSCPVVVPK